MKTRLFRYAACAGLASAIAFTEIPAQADPVADFYKGKDVKMIVGSDPGGGTPG